MIFLSVIIFSSSFHATTMNHHVTDGTTVTPAAASSISSHREFLIDGRMDTEHHLPFVGLVTDMSQGLICTGTLIHPQYVLTAAHCFDLVKGPYLFSLSPNPFESNDPSIFHPVNRVIIHPQYKGLNSLESNPHLKSYIEIISHHCRDFADQKDIDGYNQCIRDQEDAMGGTASFHLHDYAVMRLENPIINPPMPLPEIASDDAIAALEPRSSLIAGGYGMQLDPLYERGTILLEEVNPNPTPHQGIRTIGETFVRQTGKRTLVVDSDLRPQQSKDPSAALCNGDSGSSLFIESSQPGQPLKIVAVSSRLFYSVMSGLQHTCSFGTTAETAEPLSAFIQDAIAEGPLPQSSSSGKKAKQGCHTNTPALPVGFAVVGRWLRRRKNR